MLSLNRATIIGNLTRDPELRYTPNGQAVASFAVATNRSWVDNTGEKKDAVEYHEIVTWGKLAEICSQILSKGRKAYVEGRIQTRTWEGQDGVKRQKTEIVAENVLVLDKPKEWSQGGGSAAPSSGGMGMGSAPVSSDMAPPISNEIAGEGEISLDDIPF
ncbi:MAG: single-stranded DNA-binding protein [Patescibacteria group bacterium]|nr:single-stranded DNA-binding protein [Patescibacteria group bacterium]